MAERLTYAEIVKRFPNEYILLNEPEADSQHRVVSGELMFHDSNREAVAEAARKMRPVHCAFFYTGKPPTNVALAL